MNFEELKTKLKPWLQQYGKKVGIGLISLGVVLGGYQYYNVTVVKTSPQYMVDTLTKAIRNGDSDTVYMLTNLYNLIDDTARIVSLSNAKVEDWSNGNDALTTSINRDELVKAIADNILSNIQSEHRISYTGEATDVVAKAISMLGVNELEYESISLHEENKEPVLDITVHDVKKKDVKYVIHITLKRYDSGWKLDRLVSADTVIKTRLTDYKAQLTEDNRVTISLFHKLMKLNTPTIAVNDKAMPNLTAKELVNLSKEEKEKLFKLQSVFTFTVPVIVDPSVQSAKVTIALTDTSTGRVIKEVPVEYAKGQQSIQYTKDVDYTDAAQSAIVEAIKQNRISTAVTITSIITDDGTYSLKQ